jgi:peptidoglycan/xylan/chitin deacetylase (PgdA/CDA1 family)
MFELNSVPMAASLKPKTYFSFTVDVDPDLNWPVPGQIAALSHPTEKGETRFDSCAKGLELILNMLDELKIPGTFFIEARTAEKLTNDFGFDLKRMFYGHEVGCHSYMHEDFLGKDTGIPLSRKKIIEALENSLSILKDTIGKPISCFRAPYVRINDELASVLVELGFEYDSSVTLDWQMDKKENSFMPYYYFKKADMDIDNEEALIEVPLPNLIMPDGVKLTSYLWPYIEGESSFDKFGSALEQISELDPTNSIFLIATHPWHIVETYKKGIIKESVQRKFIEELSSYILKINYKPNVEFVKITEYLDTWNSLKQGEQLADILDKV